MELLYILFVLLVTSRLLGELFERLGQPALVGELVAGVLLGLTARPFESSLPVLARLDGNEVFAGLTELGIFLLMLLAGVELRPRDLKRVSGRASIVAIGGMVVPLALGLGLGTWALEPSELKSAQCLFIGVSLAITAVPVAVRVLMDIGKLESDLGRTVVAAALIDDVLSLLLLAILTGVLQSGTVPEGLGLLEIVGRALAFFALCYAFGRFVMPVLGRRLHRLQSDEFDLSFLLIAGLGLAVLAEALGLHFILGAFAAGLFFGRHTLEDGIFEAVEAKLSGLTTGFLAPIFFASVGYHLDLEALTSVPLFALAILGIATLGKVAGAGVPAYFTGLSPRESIAVGTAMNARGAVELVIADIALRNGLFDAPQDDPVVAHLYSAVVMMAVVTTLVTPPALRFLLADRDR